MQLDRLRRALAGGSKSSRVSHGAPYAIDERHLWTLRATDKTPKTQDFRSTEAARRRRWQTADGRWPIAGRRVNQAQAEVAGWCERAQTAAWLRLDGVYAAFNGCWQVLQASRRFDAAQGRRTRLALQRD